DTLKVVGSAYVFDLEIRDYNLWPREKMPVLLILYDAEGKKAYWLWVQDYFAGTGRRPSRGALTVRVHIPKRQRVTRKAIARWRQIKQQTRDQSVGETL